MKILDEMWVALAACQPQADASGHGDSWARMCREKTHVAAAAAAANAKAARAARAVDCAAEAADCAALAANALDAAAEMWAQKAINNINKVLVTQRTEQEPVAWYHDDFGTLELSRIQRVGWKLLYAARPQRPEERNFCPRCGKRTQDIHTCTPPQRTWVGLTDEEHIDIAVECGCMSADWMFYGAAVERKIKEKNKI